MLYQEESFNQKQVNYVRDILVNIIDFFFKWIVCLESICRVQGFEDISNNFNVILGINLKNYWTHQTFGFLFSANQLWNISGLF